VLFLLLQFDIVADMCMIFPEQPGGQQMAGSQAWQDLPCDEAFCGQPIFQVNTVRNT
jgi:hypothetical protein